MDNTKACDYVDKVRQLCSGAEFQCEAGNFNLGSSAGVTNVKYDTIDELYHAATACLLRASEAGGDIVIGD